MAAKQPAMRPTGESVEQVLARAHGPRRAEADELCAIMKDISGEAPKVWASRIVGFGEVTYRYESGHGGTMPVLAFPPPPTASRHTIYLTSDFEERWARAGVAAGPTHERHVVSVSHPSEQRRHVGAA